MEYNPCPCAVIALVTAWATKQCGERHAGHHLKERSNRRMPGASHGIRGWVAVMGVVKRRKGLLGCELAL